MTAHDSIMKGLNEALEFARGNEIGAQIKHVKVSSLDVAATRARTGLSQGAFAQSIGVAKGTLLNWEHGRRRLTGPAQVLLAMIDKNPSLVAELLRQVICLLLEMDRRLEQVVGRNEPDLTLGSRSMTLQLCDKANQK